MAISVSAVLGARLSEAALWDSKAASGLLLGRS